MIELTLILYRNSRIPTPNKRVTRRQAAKQEAILAAKLAESLAEAQEIESTKVDAQGDAPLELINAKEAVTEVRMTEIKSR